MADSSTRAVCVREIQKSLDQSVKQLLEDKIASLGVEDHFEVLDAEIHVLNDAGERDGRIIFQGMQNHTATSIKSLEGYRIAWVEEAQSLSQRSLDLLTPTIREAGSEIWFSWNPDKATDPVDVFMRGPGAEGDPDIICIEVNYTDNPWFSLTPLAGDMARDRRRDPDKYSHVWKGAYQSKSQARVFRNWRVENFETPESAIFRFGADWGFGCDPSVLVRAFLVGRTLYVDHCVGEVGVETDFLPFLFGGTEDPVLNEKNAQALAALKPEQKARWKGVPLSTKWAITADSARPETVSYMQRHGFRIAPAIKGQGSLEDGVEFLKSFDIVVHPRCALVEAELASYAYKTDPQTKEVLSVLEDKDNHTIDALRYALEALRRASKAAPPPLDDRNPHDPPDLRSRRDTSESYKTY